MPSVGRLKQRLAETLKARKFDAALGALKLLAREEPNESGWPRRTAKLLHIRSDTRGELAALRRALELQADQGLVLDAIATCTAILEVAPDDTRTLDTMDLLYLEGPPASGDDGVAPPALFDAKAGAAADAERDAPLDSLILTDVVPGARSIQLGVAEPGRINEIPIDLPPFCELGDSPLDDRSNSEDGRSASEENPINLHLERWSSSADLHDLAAAQAASLPAGQGAGRRGTPLAGGIVGLPQAESTRLDRGASLRSELANIPLFGDLDPASLHVLIRRVRVVFLEPCQVLFREGDAANSLYVVVEGAVVPIAEGEQRRKLAVLERGQFFGEIGLMTKQPRNATIEALVETKLLAIDRRLVWELIENQPSVAKGILRFFRARLIDRQMQTNAFFSAFVHAERKAVAKQFRFLEVEAGTRVVKHGRAPEGIFVVLSGSLGVFGDPESASSQAGGDNKELAQLGSGDVFGGMALIEGHPPTADVVSHTKCWLIVLGEGRFRRILEANPRLDRVLRRVAMALAAECASGEERQGEIVGL